LKSVAELRIVAGTAANALGLEYRQSLPIPRRDGSRLVVAFLYAIQRLVPREGAWMLPPSYEASVDAETGELIELKSVSPGDFGRQDPPERFLGAFSLPEGMTAEKYKERHAELFSLYDRLLPHFAAAPSSGPADVKQWAQEFTKIFARIAEPPLAAYYDAAASEFFAWLRQNRR
jgi:hypothetical protein